MASFFIALGTGEERLFSSEKPLLRIGRSPESEILIEEPLVSRRHAEVFRADNRYYVRDSGSLNGTFLDGKRIFQPSELSPGNVIAVGNSKIVFEPSDSVAFLKDKVAEKPSSTVNLARPMHTAQVMAPLVLLQAVADIAREVVQPKPLESLLDSILRACVEKTGAERAAMMLLDKTGALVPRAYFSRTRSGGRFAISMSIATKAIDDNQALLIKDVAGDERLRMSESIASLRIRSAICTPLWNGEKTVGVLYVDTTEAEHQFGETDLLFFSSLSGMLAEKIENTLLAEIAREKQRLDTEIEIAKDIQTNLFPKDIPGIAGYEIACFNRPSREVGGDYFDVLTVDGSYGIAIADVSGKGIGAALLMSNLQAVLRSKTPILGAPDEVLRQMNSDLHDRVGEGRFVTLFYMVLEPAAGGLVYANAGHNPPFVVSPDGKIASLEVSGVPLGILAETQYKAFEQKILPGEIVVLYSDGITEAGGRDRELFGEERLATVLRDSRTKTAAEIVDAVLLAVDTFREEEPISDDMTLVVLRSTAQAPPFSH
jgi:sigma-B regulation protein RsbU (phosphoserine phosphatase)